MTIINSESFRNVNFESVPTVLRSNRSVQTVQRSVLRSNRSMQTAQRSVHRSNRSVQTDQRSTLQGLYFGFWKKLSAQMSLEPSASMRPL
jgi:hypothetical protein